MRCSTVSGLLLVAAAAAGGLLLGVVCAAAGPNEPAIRAAPVRDAMATERAKGVNRFVMRCFLFQRSGYAAPGCRGRPLTEERPGHRTGSGKTPAGEAEDHPLVTVEARRFARAIKGLGKAQELLQRTSKPSLANAARILSRPFIDFSGPMRFSTRCVQVAACSSWRGAGGGFSGSRAGAARRSGARGWGAGSRSRRLWGCSALPRA